MEAKDRKRLEVWISNRLNAEQPDAAPLAFFKLSHLVEGAPKKPTIVEIPARDVTEPSAIASQLIDNMVGDANVAGGLQKYEVKAHYGTSETESRGGRFTMRIRGEAEDEQDELGLGGIEVSGRGFAAQQMRHNEQILRVNAGMVGTFVDSLQGLLTNMSRQLETSQTRLSESYDLLNRHANERMEREVALRQEIRREKREDMAIKVASNVLLPKLIQEYGSNDTRMMKLFDSLTPDQMEKILDTLTPEQLPMLGAVMEEQGKKLKGESDAEAARKRDLEDMLNRSEGAGGSTTLNDILVKDKP